MSLILDALKKSEAERRRGLPPTLCVQFDSAPRRARRAPWVAGAGAALLAAGLVGGWVWMGRGKLAGELDAPGTVPMAGSAVDASSSTQLAQSGGDPGRVAAPTVGPAAGTDPVFRTAGAEAAFGSVAGGGNGVSVSGGGLPVPERAMLFTPSVDPAPDVASAPPPPAAPGSTPVVTASPAQAQITEPAVAAPEAQVAASSATPETPPPAAAMVDPVAQVATPEPVEPAPTLAHAQPSVMAAQAPDPGSKSEETLLAIHQLPYATRKDLPKLALSMHVYSPEPGESFVVLNGKRYGTDTPPPGPELELLSIIADGVVLEYRGQRFLLPRQTF
ncbi:MAG: general secretion pathway protein GspB [Xanthomonadales bacterium]|nr:hypothetical protein [Xanthomonadales bacterium]MCC6593295.1 general secretion pathway protein GspB [Xanthomonadales bacterium]MCE7930496.1 hypothetical protein [Xanthomonadales bacterium PRO6]